MSQQNKRQQPAFTLFELVMVMLLISILVTLLGSIFINTYRFHGQLLGRTQRLAQYQEVRHLLQKDFNRTKYFEVSANTLTFLSEKDSIHYIFGDRIVRHQAARSDTFSTKAEILEDTASVHIALYLNQGTASLQLPKLADGVRSYYAAKDSL